MALVPLSVLFHNKSFDFLTVFFLSNKNKVILTLLDILYIVGVFFALFAMGSIIFEVHTVTIK